jgi:colanic acid biosynthesis glycosyl transferase WcaI
MVAFLRRTKFVVYLQDIYPDIAVECGKVRESFFIKVLRKFLVWCYCRADQIVVVSNDMRDWLRDHGVDASKVVVIQNWVDTEALRPIKQDNQFRADHLLDGKFVVMYSGNIGQTQRFDMLLNAAERLRHNEDIVFMIVGGGVRQQQVMDDVDLRKLSNVRFLPYQPKSYLGESLSAADMQIVMLDHRMTQLMMPSKLYSALASGTAVLGLGNPDSHLAEIIVDNGCGWFFGESQLEDLVKQIEAASEDPNLTKSVGHSSRDYAVERCNRANAIVNFAQMLGSIIGNLRPRVRLEAAVNEPRQTDEFSLEESGEMDLVTSGR